MNIKRIIISTVVIWVLSFILMMLTCGGFFSWVYKLPPNIWLTPEEMFKPVNSVISNFLGLLRAFFFVFVYAVIYKGIPGKKINRGVIYALLVWLVGAFTGIASMPFYMTISKTVVIYWLIQSLVFNLIFGVVLSLIYKKK